MTEQAAADAASTSVAASLANGHANPAATDWTAALDDDGRSFIQTKGYKTPGDLLTAYRNAERAIGADKVVLPGKDAKPEDWDAVYSKLGRPEKPEGYQFQKPEGVQSYSDEFANTFRTWAHKHGLNAKQAAGLHDEFVSLAKGQETQQAQAMEAERMQTERALRAEWGQDYDKQMSLAKKAMRLAGDDAAIAAIEKVSGASGVVKLFAKIGGLMAEDQLVAGGAALLSNTPEGAKAEIERINTEKAAILGDPRHPEHAGLVKRRNELYNVAYPGNVGAT